MHSKALGSGIGERAQLRLRRFIFDAELTLGWLTLGILLQALWRAANFIPGFFGHGKIGLQLLHLFRRWWGNVG